MPNQFQIFSSNRIECLYQRLKSSLFGAPSSPFARRLVIVPSPAMKAWLALQLAQDPECGISAGIEVGYPDQSIRSIVDLTRSPENRPEGLYPSNMELALALEMLIRKAMDHYAVMARGDQEQWNPLLKYLGYFNSRSSQKLDRRLAALCVKLSRLFKDYTLYGSVMLKEWVQTSVPSWQPLLWRQLLADFPKLAFPYQEIEEAVSRMVQGGKLLSSKKLEIHLFAVSFLAAKHHAFLQHVSDQVPVNYYMLSPCQVFWSDLCTDKEKAGLEAYWKKRGISADQQTALEEFLRERNPLLANFGRLGREMAKQVEEANCRITEDYVAAKGVKGHPQYDPIMVVEDALFDISSSGHGLTMLEAMQADMLLLRNPDPGHRIELKRDDRSFEMHVAPSRRREVEIVYDRILGIMQEHADEEHPIAPKDFIVMAPDIMEYEAHVRSVFGSKDSVLDFQIMDMRMPAQSELIRGFLHLLDLAGSRWEAEAILEIFEYPSFQRRHGLTHEEVGQIRDWIRESGVRWGQTVGHRREKMAQDHSQRNLVDDSPCGTWEFGTDRLLAALAIDPSGMPDTAADQHRHFPVEGIDVSLSALLGQWLFLLASMKADLENLSGDSCRTTLEWASYLQCLLEAYFQQDVLDKTSSEDWNALECQIRAIGQAARVVGQAAYPFTTIKKHLLAALNKDSTIFRESHLHGVKFCSMLPMRALPSQAIIVMGMHEGAYPKTDLKLSLNAMAGHPHADYCPGQADFDRYVFLEALLSARKYFLVSYPGYSAEDSKAQPPSLLVQELLAYADNAYAMEGITPVSGQIIYKHPFHSFDKLYFQRDSHLQTFSKDNYLLAKAYYSSTLQKKSPHRLVSHFSIHAHDDRKTDEAPVPVDMKDLASFAKDPVKAYFNKTLGVYLKNREDSRINSVESFGFAHMHKAQILKEALKKPLRGVYEKAEQEGILPPGMFKDLAAENLKIDLGSIQANCMDMGVDLRSLTSIRFSDHCTDPYQNELGEWQLPPLQIPVQGKFCVKLTGAIPHVSSEGILDIKEGKETAALNQWPYYMALHHAIRAYGLPMRPQLLFAKDGTIKRPFTDNLDGHLADFLDYYFLGLKSISPLIPEWVPSILKADASDLAGKMQASFGDYAHFYHDYVLWLFKDENGLPQADAILQDWQPKAQALYGEMLAHWFPPKSR